MRLAALAAALLFSPALRAETITLFVQPTSFTVPLGTELEGGRLEGRFRLDPSTFELSRINVATTGGSRVAEDFAYDQGRVTSVDIFFGTLTTFASDLDYFLGGNDPMLRNGDRAIRIVLGFRNFFAREWSCEVAAGCTLLESGGLAEAGTGNLLTTWRDAAGRLSVPAPAAAALFSLSAAGLLAARRRGAR